MNYLFFSDLHINQKELTECCIVLQEIGNLCDKYHVDKIFDLGDTFDNINPESECLDAFSYFIKTLNLPMIILVAQSHESETNSISVINHFGILKETINVVKEYHDNDNLYCGHFIVSESKLNKFGATISKKDLLKYKYVILGHGHSHEVIAPNIVQLGSCRYIDFAEVNDKVKLILLIENYGETNEKCHFIKLNSYPMKEYHLCGKNSKKTLSQGENDSVETLCQTLDRLDPKTKVRVIIDDFQAYKDFLPIIGKYKSKFVLFKIKNNFEITFSEIKTEDKNLSFKDSFKQWIEKQNLDKSIKDILMEELK